jgi:hypothetical protein
MRSSSGRAPSITSTRTSAGPARRAEQPRSARHA